MGHNRKLETTKPKPNYQTKTMHSLTEQDLKKCDLFARAHWAGKQADAMRPDILALIQKHGTISIPGTPGDSAFLGAKITLSHSSNTVTPDLDQLEARLEELDARLEELAQLVNRLDELEADGYAVERGQMRLLAAEREQLRLFLGLPTEEAEELEAMLAASRHAYDTMSGFFSSEHCTDVSHDEKETRLANLAEKIDGLTAQLRHGFGYRQYCAILDTLEPWKALWLAEGVFYKKTTSPKITCTMIPGATRPVKAPRVPKAKSK